MMQTEPGATISPLSATGKDINMKYYSYRNGTFGIRAFENPDENVPATVETFDCVSNRLHTHEEFLTFRTAMEVLRQTVRNVTKGELYA